MKTTGFFDALFEKAMHNSMVIMNQKGLILKVNRSFTGLFGYTSEDLAGKPFEVLFIEEDRMKGKPAIEIENVLTNGNAIDINYLLHKNGNPVWVAGESVLVEQDDNWYIVKVLQNIHTQKVLEQLLADTNDLLAKLFSASHQTPLVLFDSALMVVKANEPFGRFFDMDILSLAGKKLSEIQHPFWGSKEVKASLRSIAIKGEETTDKPFFYECNNQRIPLLLSSKNIFGKNDSEKRTLVLIKTPWPV